MEVIKQMLWLLMFTFFASFILAYIIDAIIKTYKKVKLYKKQLQKKNRQIQELKEKQEFLYELYK